MSIELMRVAGLTGGVFLTAVFSLAREKLLMWKHGRRFK